MVSNASLSVWVSSNLPSKMSDEVNAIQGIPPERERNVVARVPFGSAYHSVLRFHHDPPFIFVYYRFQFDPGHTRLRGTVLLDAIRSNKAMPLPRSLSHPILGFCLDLNPYVQRPKRLHKDQTRDETEIFVTNQAVIQSVVGTRRYRITIGKSIRDIRVIRYAYVRMQKTPIMKHYFINQLKTI